MLLICSYENTIQTVHRFMEFPFLLHSPQFGGYIKIENVKPNLIKKKWKHEVL